MNYINKFFPILLVSTLLLTVVGCKKDPEGLGDEASKAKIAIFNFATPTRSTAPNATTFVQGYFLTMDGVRLYTMALPTGKSTGYFLAEAGTRVINADTAVIQQNVVNPSATVKTTSLQTEANKYYSIYYTGLNQNPEVVITTDDLTRPANDKVKIRVINLSPDAGNLDVAGRLTNETTPRMNLFTALSYKTNNAFREIPPGFYSLEIKETSTGTVFSSFTDDNQNPPRIQPSTSLRANFSMLFEGGKIYTLIINGYRTPTIAAVGQPAQPLAVSAAINLYF